MALTEARKGEIALALWKYKLEKDGLDLSPEKVRREVGNLAKATEISFGEIMEFGEELASELVKKSFPVEKKRK